MIDENAAVCFCFVSFAFGEQRKNFGDEDEAATNDCATSAGRGTTSTHSAM